MSPTRWLAVLAVFLFSGCARATTSLPDPLVASPTPAPPMSFPRDAGPHDALTEWWYYTGHLSTANGRTYGFEFVVFQARREGAPTGYASHFAISDVEWRQFSHQARFGEGATFTGFPLTVGGWALDRYGSADDIQAAMDAGPGVAAPFALQLRLVDEKPPALHHGGYIDYGPAGGSYYYSRTRLSVSGSLGLAGGAAAQVSGIAWMDHQWGNFVVSTSGGWDWYSLQLDDDTELMLYVLRAATGETTAVYGSLVQADGNAQELPPGAVSAVATGEWVSPHTGGVYPSGWQLTLGDGSSLVVTPQLDDQELWFPDWSAGGLAYWEGAVKVTGARSGVGYVELTGYARR